MKIVARIREPEKITARFKEVVLSKDDRYAEGYDAGMGAANAARDELDASRLTDINTELVKNGTTAADTLDGVDEKIPEVHAAGYLAGGNAGYTAGHRDGEFAGYGRGVAETNEKRDAEIAAELNEINEVIERNGGTKAETLDGVSESVSATIGAASMKAQTDGYEQGVKDVNAARDVIDASRLDDINAALTANGGTAADTLDGVDEKIPAVHAAGVQSEYDRFWDALQLPNQPARSYAYMFYNWTDEMYNPKYDIVFGIPTHFYSDSARSAFANFQGTDLKVNLVATGLTVIGLDNTFNGATNLVNARTISVAEGVKYTNTFNNCKSLVEIRFDGVIGQSGLNFQHSTKLSRASIESIIGALSTTASGKSITLSATAVRTAYGASADTDLSTYEPWTSVANTRSNWTISLV